MSANLTPLVLITGASKGSIGAEVAISLATSSPKQFILVGRNKTKINPVIEQIKAINSNIEVAFVSGDFCNNACLRKAAAEINALNVTIDSIICSAGTMAVREFTPSKDGVENQFAANFLGHFLLVLPSLANAYFNRMARHIIRGTLTARQLRLRSSSHMP
jgi:NAD(P)-dependent dehydrogenase (short-subunit alcohol dehydrogenase family)